jgi:NAD(P)-dependent dehydrogenase (short-subunit alcohol dehydrogenase family)
MRHANIIGKETNVHGVFLITQGFLKLLGKKRGSIVTLTVFPGMSSYAISKLAGLQM